MNRPVAILSVTILFLAVAGLFSFIVLANSGFPPSSPPYCNTGCSYTGGGSCSCPSGDNYSANSSGSNTNITGSIFLDSNWNGYYDQCSIFGCRAGDTQENLYTAGKATFNVNRYAYQTVVSSTSFTGNGTYSFPVYWISPSAKYSIAMVPPSGYIVTSLNPATTTVIPANRTGGPFLDTPAQNPAVNFGVDPGFTISGNIYQDDNGDKKKDNGEANYTDGSVTVQFTPNPGSCYAAGGACMGADQSGFGGAHPCTDAGGTKSSSYSCSNDNAPVCCLPDSPTPTAAQTAVTSDGTYTSPTLYPGSYTVSINPPVGSTMSYPLNGPPPSFSVSVGGSGSPSSCSTNATVGSTCSNGNISSLDFGLAGKNTPWLQVNGLDARLDDGLTNIAPSTANAACTSYTVGSGSSSAPGVLYTGDSNADFGGSQVSSTNWLVGGSLYPEIFSAGTGNLLHVSYTQVSNKLKQSAITPTDMTTISGCSVLSSCSLPSGLSNGVYKANGDLTLTGNYTFPADKNYVFLINGNLFVKGNIIVPNTSTATFIASGNITVDRSVGTTPACPPTGQVEGVFSAGQNFVIDGYNDPSVQTDTMLNIQGTVITNANLEGGSLENNRDLGGSDASYPAFTITGRPDFALHLPDLLKSQLRIQQEVAP